MTIACSSDPVYLEAVPPSLTTGDEGAPATLRLSVPFAVETEDQAAERMELATSLGLPVEQVPTARRDDVDLEIEWSLTNNGEEQTVAFLTANGANELFAYDPGAIIVEDEEDAPPPLMGGRPVILPAGATVSGLFREDELIEAAQDLDAFTRGGVIPERALIERWPTPDVTGGTGGALETIPSAAIPVLLVIDVAVAAGEPVTLTAKLRVRDRTGRLVANPTAADALVAPAATIFMPTPAMP